MKVALYARVSTKASDKKATAAGEREKQNPELQLQRLRDFANAHGWDIIGEYLDRASGAKMDRPQLKQVLLDGKAKNFDIILITKLDRMMRSLVNLQNIVTELRSWGVGLVCIDQPIDTRSSSPTANLTMNVLAAVAEFERELISERVKDSDLSKAGRPKKHKHLDEQMIREALDGRSLDAAAEFLQVPLSTMRYHIRKAGGLSHFRQW